MLRSSVVSSISGIFGPYDAVGWVAGREVLTLQLPQREPADRGRQAAGLGHRLVQRRERGW